MVLDGGELSLARTIALVLFEFRFTRGQLQVAQGASAQAQLDSFTQQWTSERLLRFQLKLLVARRDGTDRAQLPLGAAVALANFWDTVAGIFDRPHVDRLLFWTAYGNVFQSWWMTLEPFIQRTRKDEGNQSLWGTFEKLGRAASEWNKRASLPEFHADWTPSLLARRIAICQERIEVEEAMRTPIAAPPETP